MLHVSPDERGGMVYKMADLPEVWPEIARRQIVDKAKWTRDLVDAALKTFMIDTDKLDSKLVERRL